MECKNIFSKVGSLGHSSQIQQGSGIDIPKFSSNFCHLIAMREVFSENLSFITQFSLSLWLFKVLQIV